MRIFKKFIKLMKKERPVNNKTNFTWVIDESKFLNISEVRKLENYCYKLRAFGLRKRKFSQIRNWFMTELGLNAGLRVEEMASLKHGNLLIDQIRSSLVVTGKGGKKRAVWISSNFKNKCMEYFGYKKDFGYDTDDESYLLNNLKGNKISKRALQKFFKDILKKSGLPSHYYIHCLRHTYTTFLLMASSYNYRFAQKQLGHSSIRTTQVYAGILDSEGRTISRGLIRKGVGVLKIFDGDTVELSNLSRQCFYEDDLYKNKALCLAKNLVKEGVKKTEIIGYPFMIQKAIEDKLDVNCDIVICAPDNDDTRIFVSRYFYSNVPAIFTGLDQNANTGYIFIQEPGMACLGCALPHSINNKREPCPNTPAIIDLVKIIAGFILFAIDSTIMERKRNWNFRQIFLDGIPEFLRVVDRNESCSLCGG